MLADITLAYYKVWGVRCCLVMQVDLGVGEEICLCGLVMCGQIS